MGRLKPYIITLAVLILGGTVAGKAQSLALKTNMLYDLVVTPSVGVEVGVTDRWSVAFNGTYGWLEGSPWYDNVRVVTGDAELRYWFSHADSPLSTMFATKYDADPALSAGMVAVSTVLSVLTMTLVVGFTSYIA